MLIPITPAEMQMQQWIAICALYLLSSIWSEDNVRFGYIIVPFMAGFFWSIGFLQFSYLGTIIPIVIMMGILAYLKSQLKYKYGVFGSGGSLLWKIVAFVVFIQFAIVFVNGLMIFNSAYVMTPVNEFTAYNVTSAQAVYASSTTAIGALDAVSTGFSLIWMSWNITWSMILSFFTLFPSLMTNFHVPPTIAVIISGGIYLLTALEVFVLLFKPYRAPEV
jgi:hypothetical protein